jgi:mannose-6-phosphate isomerase-like protein (cupin superfamily)
MLKVLAAVAIAAAPFYGAHSMTQPSTAVLDNGVAAEAHALLEALAADFRNDPSAINSYFGIKLGDRFWTVEVERHETATPRGRLTDHRFGPHRVTLRQATPERPTWYFEIADIAVLRRIARGEINAGTAAMQSFESDRVGVETRSMDGFTMTSGDQANMYLALSHFFTTGVPEITRFGRDTSLPTHGASVTALHMMKGFRVAHFSIGPDQTANEDPRLESGQMPNLFIVTRGRGIAHLGDRTIELSEGMSVFIPPFVRHQIRNNSDQPLEGVLVLYGDNSDFAFGTSYPAFMQDLNDFYRSYPFRRNQVRNPE